MELHPVCYIFPEMDKDQFEALSTDIAKNGLLTPIVTYKGQIIDGRHRYRACLILGKAPHYLEWDGNGSLTQFVVGLNLHRRHLSTSQRAAIAVEVKQQLEVETREKLKAAGKRGGERSSRSAQKEDKPLPNLVKAYPEPESPRDSTAESAKLADVSKGTLINAVAIKKADPELFEAVKAGTKTVNAAKQEIKRKTETPKYNPDDDKNNWIPFKRCRADIPSVATMILQWIEGERLNQLVTLLQERIK